MLTPLISTEVTDYDLPPGYTWRGATFDDLAAVTRTLNAHARHVIGVDDVLAESLRTGWSSPQINLAEDTRVILAPDGTVAAYGDLWGLFEPYTQIHTWLRTHPDHEQQGLEAAWLNWAETRARQAALPRAAEGTRVCLIGQRYGVDAAGIAAYERAGFRVARYSHLMQIELDTAPPAPVWPTGVTLRTFVPNQDEEAVLQVERKTFRDHWGYVAPTYEDDLKMLRHWMSHPRFDPALWLLVMAGEQLIAISLNMAHRDEDPDMGWITTLGVLREYRHQGIAKALLLHGFGQFYQRGQKRAGLGVDTQNLTGALRLYEGVGLRAYRTLHYLEKELRPGVELSTQTLA